MDIAKRHVRRAARVARQSISFQFQIEKKRAPSSFADFVFHEEKLIENFLEVKVNDDLDTTFNKYDDEKVSTETVILTKETEPVKVVTNDTENVTNKVANTTQDKEKTVKKAGKITSKTIKQFDKNGKINNEVKYKPGMAPRKAVGPILKPSTKQNVFKFSKSTLPIKGTKGSKSNITPPRAKLSKKIGTPGVKFDLQASLKRKPTWKMHTGGLKKTHECYTPDAMRDSKKASKIQEFREKNKEDMKNGIKSGRSSRIMKSRKFV